MKRIGVIGCGLRADGYLQELKSGMGKEWELAALADPKPLAIETYRKIYGHPELRVFADGPEMLKAMPGELDAVIIASPNALHLEALLPALERNLIVMLEKPVATTVEDCRSMWDAYVKAGYPPLAVGFVLRYTAFYRKAKEIIDSGAIGQVMSIEAAELLGPPLTSVFTRGWRRKNGVAGSFLLEKCSHDMDILNCLAGAPAVSVSSFGKRTVFVPKPEAAMHCRDCRLHEDCRYSAGNIAPYLMNTPRRDELGALIPQHEDLCVFNSDKDVPDHQVVNVAYENGVLAAFTLCMDQPVNARTLRVNGSEGQICGDIGREELYVTYHRRSIGEELPVERVPLVHDNSSHHGGDSVLVNQLKAMLRGETVVPLAGLREGVEACMVALGAERSLVEGRIVEVERLR